MVHELGLTYNVLLMQSKKAASAVNIVDEIYIHDLSQRINTEILVTIKHEIDINQIQKSLKIT